MAPKRILVVCPHPEGVAPAQRLHYEQYFGHLRANGFEITVSPFMTRAFWRLAYQRGHFAAKVFWTLVGYLFRVRDVFRLPFYDGAYVFLWVTPFGPPIFERVFRWLSRRMIYDINDLVFLRRASVANRFLAFLKGRSKPLYLMRSADHVVVCTPYLESIVREHHPCVTDIPTTVDTDVYLPRERHANDHKLVLGWSGSHSTAPFLHLLDSVLKDLARELDFVLLVIGAPDFRMEGVAVEAVPWRLETEVEDLRRIDIGLYPLPDELWVQGKGGGKAVQYMALGIPPVASPFGCTDRVVVDGVSGFLATTSEEWKSRIRALAADPELRRLLGAAGRRRVEEMFSVRSKCPVYLDIFRMAYGTPEDGNLDPETVRAFGREWSIFDHAGRVRGEARRTFEEYFSMFPWESLPAGAEGFDVGCGSGRWARFVADKVRRLHLVDPSVEALAVARRNLVEAPNCEFHLAGVDNMPMPDESMDFGYSLGVLHHLKDPQAGLRACAAKLKPGAPFLVYLYYALENRPGWYRWLWWLSHPLRVIISRLPPAARYIVTQLIAGAVYWPCARLCLRMERAGWDVSSWPLAYYRNRSFYAMRNDALDRFGTRVEKRFTMDEIRGMMAAAGCENISFRQGPPYWCVLGFKEAADRKA
ncbi:MAG: methyltransferase domain-containing protein [Elusimicrobia bacterium]|nr:methyltransferase domain-containing protein [Elusimicrobiota bacterium]